MDLTSYYIGLVWGIAASYIFYKIYNYYKTKQMMEEELFSGVFKAIFDEINKKDGDNK